MTSEQAGGKEGGNKSPRVGLIPSAPEKKKKGQVFCCRYKETFLLLFLFLLKAVINKRVKEKREDAAVNDRLDPIDSKREKLERKRRREEDFLVSTSKTPSLGFVFPSVALL